VDHFSIAFVCTGNRFRSVLAEAFVHRLTLGLPVTTESFGTLSLEDAPAHPEAIEIAVGCGFSIEEHRSRYVNNVSLAETDLVLGFELAHVRQAVVDAGARRGHTFLMNEFVPLLPPSGGAMPSDDLVGRARALVTDVAERASDSPDARGRGIRDPYGGPWKLHRDTATEIRELSLTLAARLFGVTNTGVLLPVPSKSRGRPRRRLRLGRL
jgi:protein-tyrosine-phosphatase